MTATRNLQTIARALGCLGAFAMASALPAVASAATLYLNDFSTTSLPNATAAFALDAPNGTLNYSDTAAPSTNPVSTASVEVAGVGVPGFVVSSRFTLNAAGTNTANLSTIGLGALATSTTFLSTGGNSYYLADWGVNSTSNALGQLRIVALGDNSDFSGVMGDSDGANANGSSVVEGATYELRLTGEYEMGALNLTLALFDGSGTQLGVAATAEDLSPLAGTHFGFRHRLVNNSGTTSISFDDFRIESIPEPAAASLALAGAWAVMAAGGGLKLQRSRGFTCSSP